MYLLCKKILNLIFENPDEASTVSIHGSTFEFVHTEQDNKEMHQLFLGGVILWAGAHDDAKV